MPATKRKAQKPPVETDEKAGDQLRIRISETLKEQLKDALKEHKHFRGNVSQFVVECAMAYIVQTRKGEVPLHPIEFVTKGAR